MATKPANPAKKFQELLLNFSQTEVMTERKQIEGTLWDIYGAKFAVFILDMSGFSMLTRSRRQMLPLQQEAHEVRRGDRLYFLTQASNGQTMDSGQ